ncbi:hypothetical protein GEV33_001429 [Tenebrio molitor]|uniref:Uncharacterized protein n=1 Tax=Tenebrio molitor TaxID=7067 RepID=A0A8J6LJI9_TENMO|nr:hypothetical protein GEV33_001429 [Tenebrio molitor]
MRNFGRFALIAVLDERPNGNYFFLIAWAVRDNYDGRKQMDNKTEQWFGATVSSSGREEGPIVEQESWRNLPPKRLQNDLDVVTLRGRFQVELQLVLSCVKAFGVPPRYKETITSLYLLNVRCLKNKPAQKIIYRDTEHSGRVRREAAAGSGFKSLAGPVLKEIFFRGFLL